MQTATSSHTISELNALLRGELAATETYQQALAKLGDQAGTEDLRKTHDGCRDRPGDHVQRDLPPVRPPIVRSEAEPSLRVYLKCR